MVQLIGRAEDGKVVRWGVATLEMAKQREKRQLDSGTHEQGDAPEASQPAWCAHPVCPPKQAAQRIDTPMPPPHLSVVLPSGCAQAFTRLFVSLRSWEYRTCGGYSGVHVSLSSRKRWLRGSPSAAASRRRSASACVVDCWGGAYGGGESVAVVQRCVQAAGAAPDGGGGVQASQHIPIWCLLQAVWHIPQAVPRPLAVRTTLYCPQNTNTRRSIW